MENRKRNVGIWALAGILGTIAYAQLSDLNNGTNKPIKFGTEKEIVQVRDYSNKKIKDGPIYSEDKVPANMCARYVRCAAEELFGIKYPVADAWDIRDDINVEEIKVDSKNTLENLAKDGSLKEGMIVGFYNPNSKYNARAEEDGAGYTHVMIYLGKDEEKLFFADKFGKKTRIKISLDEIIKSGLDAREVMYLKN